MSGKREGNGGVMGGRVGERERERGGPLYHVSRGEGEKAE